MELARHLRPRLPDRAAAANARTGVCAAAPVAVRLL
jgi:hypothetical protein